MTPRPSAHVVYFAPFLISSWDLGFPICSAQSENMWSEALSRRYAASA